MKTYQLKTRQICFFFLAFTVVNKLFTLPSLTSSLAKEDLWISSLINLTLDFLTIFALIIVCKRQNLSFLELLEKNFGKMGAKIVIFLYALYFLLKAYMPINEQKSFVELALYINLTTDIYFLPFFALAFFLALKPLKTIGRISDIVWLFTVIGLTLLITLSISNTDFYAVLPIGASGVKKIFSASYVGANWYGEGAYFLFFIGNFKFGKKDGAKILSCYAVGVFIVTAFMIIFYGVFTSIAFRQSFALTEIAKYTTVINNIGRFDYVGILMLLFSNVFALSIPVFFSAKCLDYVFNFNKKWIAPLIVTAILLLTTMYLNEFYATLQKVFSLYLSAFFLIMANVLPLITLFFSRKEKKNEKA